MEVLEAGSAQVLARKGKHIGVLPVAQLTRRSVLLETLRGTSFFFWLVLRH